MVKLYTIGCPACNVLEKKLAAKNIEFDKNVKSYALALNQFYLSSLNSLLNQSKGLRFSSEYKVLRSGKRNTTIVVTIPYRLDRRIYPSMCVMVSFGKNVQYEGVITFRRDNGDAFITLLECYNFAYDSGFCQVECPIPYWVNPQYPWSAGQLLNHKTMNYSLAQCYAGASINPLFKQNHLATLPSLSMSPEETRVLSEAVKQQLSIVDCGERIVDYAVLAGYSLHSFCNKQIIYISNNDWLLDNVSLTFDSVMNDRSVIHCFRVGNSSHVSNKASQNSLYRYVIKQEQKEPSTQDELFSRKTKAIETMKETGYLAVSLDSIENLQFLKNYVIIVLDAERLYDIVGCRLLQNCSQMMLLTRTKFVGKAKLGEYVVPRLLAAHHSKLSVMKEKKEEREKGRKKGKQTDR